MYLIDKKVGLYVIDLDYGTIYPEFGITNGEISNNRVIRLS